MKKSYVFFAIVLALIVSCKENKKKVEESQQKTVVKKVEIPVFNADSAYYFTEKQVAFGPRVPNTKAQELCANYLVTVLKRYSKIGRIPSTIMLETKPFKIKKR